MPSKKKKYNARFPAGRIKKIMQTDEEVGKVAQAVPVIISRTLELFVGSLLTKSMLITQSRNAKTLTPSHMKQCILSESRFDFLKDLVKNIPDASAQEDNENNAIFEANLHQLEAEPEPVDNNLDPPAPSVPANFYTEQSTSTSRTPVIQYGPDVTQDTRKLNFTVTALGSQSQGGSKIQVPVPPLVPASNSKGGSSAIAVSCDDLPPLIPLAPSVYGQTSEDSLCIDEDYDN